MTSSSDDSVDGTADGPADDSVNGSVDGTAGGDGIRDDDVRDDFDEIVADSGLDSDDRSDVGLAGDGDLRERVPVGAGTPAGSARAAARASAVRAGVTPGKGHATRSRNQSRQRVSVYQRLVRFLREVVAELRKVIWPTRNEMVTYSIVVVIFLIFMIAVTWGADFGFARLILSIFG